MTASFDFIRYAAVWEDADVLLDALALPPGASVLCICSAGDNALSLLTTAPAHVVAIDLSEPQLHLAMLKKAAFEALAYEDVVLFLGTSGRAHTAERTALYRTLRDALPPAAAAFWDARPDVVATGVLDAGKFERYFAAFRRWALPLVHSRQAVAELLRPKDDAAQARYYRAHWNNRRWQALLSLFFSRLVLGRFGRDPAFLEHVNVPVSTYIRQRAEAHLQASLATRNPFLHRIFTGRYGPVLPHYLRPDAYAPIRANLSALRFQSRDAAQAMEQAPYDAYALSNIFEYMAPDTFDGFVRRVTPHIPPGARLAFWNLMVPRAFHTVLPDAYRAADTLGAADRDTGFFYSRFQLETRV